jgi:putative oxidoreductase
MTRHVSHSILVAAFQQQKGLDIMNLKQLLDTRAGWEMTILRVVTGIVYLGHGLGKWGWDGSDRTIADTANWLGGSLHLPFPMLMAFLVGFAEIFGGAFLIVGLATRPSALMQVIAMLVAVFLVHFDGGIMGMFAKGGYQWALLLMACSAALMIAGPGKLSADQMIADRLN